MRQLRFSLGMVGMLCAYPVSAALADAPQPAAADAGSGKEVKAKHKAASASDAHGKHEAADAAAEAHGEHADAHVKRAATDPAAQAAKHATSDPDGHAKHKHAASAEPPPPVAATAPVVTPKPAPVAPVAAPPIAAAPKPSGPTCSLEEAEQPRGGRLDVLGNDFGQAPVVRIAARPARMLERRADRISVQVPADSDGGAVTLQTEGHSAACGTLVIIGKNR